MRAFLVITLLLVVIAIGLTSAEETIHAKNCDDRCGGSKLNPFGPNDDCDACCKTKGFYRGGSCGDFGWRHCRCLLNPPQNYGGR